MRAAAASAIRSGQLSKLPPGLVDFTNTNRYHVPDALLFEFIKSWAVREASLREADGFLGLTTSIEGPGVVVVRSLWQSVPQWERWSTTSARKMHNLPEGVAQYAPSRGEGFPEDFLPFKDLEEVPNAKY